MLKMLNLLNQLVVTERSRVFNILQNKGLRLLLQNNRAAKRQMRKIIFDQLLAMTVYSDQYKASWIYYSAPVERPGVVMAGAFKGIWVKYFMPMYFLVSVFVLYVWGAAKLLDVALAFANITVFGLLIVRIAHRRLPFSTMEQMNEKGNRFLKSLFVMLVPFCFGFGHFWAAKTPFVWLRGLFFALSLISI